MSGVTLNSTGGGSIALQPASTASSRTVTIPDATGTAMVSGAMPAFSAYQSVGTSVSTNTWTKVAFQTKEFDTNSNYDNTTNYRFTPTVAGYYQISAAYYISVASNTGFKSISIYKNGTSYKQIQSDAGPSGWGGIGISTLIYFNGSTDYVEIYCVLSAVAGTTTTGIANTWFNGVLVRAA